MSAESTAAIWAAVRLLISFVAMPEICVESIALICAVVSEVSWVVDMAMI